MSSATLYGARWLPGASSSDAIIGNCLLDPLCRRLQVDCGQHYNPADYYQRGNNEGDSKKHGHRENLISTVEMTRSTGPPMAPG